MPELHRFICLLEGFFPSFFWLAPFISPFAPFPASGLYFSTYPSCRASPLCAAILRLFASNLFSSNFTLSRRKWNRAACRSGPLAPVHDTPGTVSDLAMRLLRTNGSNAWRKLTVVSYSRSSTATPLHDLSTRHISSTFVIGARVPVDARLALSYWSV